jgi:uncharacterized protein (DUF305 family)
MSLQRRNTLLNSVRLPLGALTMAVALLAVPTFTSAQEPAVSDSPAPSSMPMDHAGMTDMKAHQGMSMTGDADYDFAVNMRKHHQMAVTMAQAELKNGKNAEMRDMASKIIVAQRKEIAELDRWTAAHEKTK